MPFKTFLSYWSSLQKRERYVAAGGAACLVLLLTAHFILLPFLEARSKMTRSISRQEKVLKELSALNAQYHGLRGGTEDFEKVVASRDPAFTMASHLDKIINETEMKSSIQDFQSTKSPAAAGYQLIRTEIKIGQVTMDQLIKFLYLAERPETGIRIEQLTITKTAGGNETLTAALALKTYERKPAGS